MTNYKIIKFNCNCKYLYITNSEHRILKAVKRCPRHGALRKHVEVICESCGKRLIIKSNTSWQRKKRCNECRLIYQREAFRKQQRAKVEKRRTVVPVQNVALQTALQKVALRKFCRELDDMFRLPGVDMPMLDSLIVNRKAGR